MNDVPSRRRFLAGLGGIGLAGLAGCSALTSSNPEPTPDYWVESLFLYNRDDRAHDLDLAVFRDDEIVLWRTYHLAGLDESTGRDEAAPELPPSSKRAGDWVLAARLVGTNTTLHRVLRKPASSPAAMELELHVTPTGGFDLWFDATDG